MNSCKATMVAPCCHSLALNTLKLAEVTGHSTGRGEAAVVLYPDWFSLLSILKMGCWAFPSKLYTWYKKEEGREISLD